MKRKKKASSSDSGGGWLVTFSDLMTLLLAFFVLLFSMSTINETKYEALINSIQNALTGTNGPTIFNEFIDQSEDSASVGDLDITDVIDQGQVETDEQQEQQPSSEELVGVVSDFLSGEGLDSEVAIHIVEEGILLDVKENIFFDLGKSEIKPESIETLSRLGTLFSEFEDPIRVIGHTDNIPINTGQYPSNWELGASRACAIVRYYIRQGYDAGRFVCSSYGDTQPIDTNDTPEGREQNRRVNFLIEAEPEEIKKLSEKIHETVGGE